MKFATIPSLLLGLALGPYTIADTFSISKCICATDTHVGYHSQFHIKGPTSGFGDDAGRYNWSYDYMRDDLSYPRKEGWLCAEDTLSNCKRIPDIRQYFSRDDMVPRVRNSNCFTLAGRDVCSQIFSLKLDVKAKGLPLTNKYVDIGQGGECDARCRSLWPGDESAMSLCARTVLDKASKLYGKRVLAGSRYYQDDADRCWSYVTPEWDWNKLKRS